MPAAHPPIPLPDYQRIFRVVKTVLDGTSVEIARPAVFFSMAGAYLLEQYYKKRCQPVAGAAFYRIDDAAGTVLSFADLNQGGETLSSDQDFHCWVMCEDYVIDFMAPVFRESLHATGITADCSRKMFQKPRSAMSDSRLLMRKPGDFFMLPDVGLTRDTMDRFFASEAHTDLLKICGQWYRKPPKEMPRQASLQREDGSVTQMTLNALSLVGAW